MIEEGDVGAGDPVQVTVRPPHGITLRFMVEALEDDAKAAALRALPRLPEFWRRVANRNSGLP